MSNDDKASRNRRALHMCGRLLFRLIVLPIVVAAAPATRAEQPVHSLFKCPNPSIEHHTTAVGGLLDEARTTIGVGEYVTLLFSGVSPGAAATWSVVGVGHMSDPGEWHEIGFIAGDVPGTAILTAAHGGDCKATISFNVIAPSRIVYRQRSETLHHVGMPDISFISDMYLMPDTVSFYGIRVREVDSKGVATGAYAPFVDAGHIKEPTTLWVGLLEKGLGWKVQGGDITWCCIGWPEKPPSWEEIKDGGSYTFDIPLQYIAAPDGDWHNFATAEAKMSIATTLDGNTLTASKVTLPPSGDGVSVSLPMSAPTFWPLPPQRP